MDFALHVFHHHYRVIDNDSYGQYQPEQGEVVQRKAKELHHREGAHQ